MRLSWDDAPSRKYEAGVDRVVFYPKSQPGVAWNGITAINETETNANASVLYVDGQKIINTIGIGDFAASIVAFTYPDEFEPFDGYSAPAFAGQKRELFNLTYRSLQGVAGSIFSNTPIGLDYGYKLHLVYNCLATPTTRSNKTEDNSVDILDFTWDITTTPEALPYDRPTAHFVVDSLSVIPNALIALENLLYGTEGNTPRMPTIPELITLFEANALFIVTDNGNGTVTITGPDDQVYVDPVIPTLVHLNSPGVQIIDSNSFRASTY